MILAIYQVTMFQVLVYQDLALARTSLRSVPELQVSVKEYTEASMFAAE